MTRPLHVPVLRDRVVDLLTPALTDDTLEPAHARGVLVDATVGLGGHAEAVLADLPGTRVVGIDRDAHAQRRAAERLAPYADRYTGVHARYDEIPEVLAGLGLRRAAAVLFDLGVSSMQLDETERGFAYADDAPLDMRMDDRDDLTAADVLNTYQAADLARILREYGEERHATRIARAVVRARADAPFDTSGRLVALLYDVIPAPARRTGGHPAKRTFQALRIEVNDELAVLRRAMPAALASIAAGGRVVVEAYQSLEDRIVKRALTAVTSLDVPPDLPFVPAGAEPDYRLLTRGAEQADAGEIEANPRSASVRLRAVERLTDPDTHPPTEGARS